MNQNLLINGTLQIWQRGTTITNPNNAYICDRMKLSGSGTASRTNANGGMTITGNINLRYIMEDLDYAHIAGNAVTLSYSKDGNIITDTYQSDRYDAVTGGCIVVNIDLTNCTIEWLKLELGNARTLFVPRPFVEELAQCQRYYEKSYNLNILPGTDATAGLSFRQSHYAGYIGGRAFAIPKRVEPTMTIYSKIGTKSSVSSVNLVDVLTNVMPIASYLSQNNFELLGATGAVAGSGYTYHWTADAEL